MNRVSKESRQKVRVTLSEKCRERNPELHGEYNIRGVPCVVILDTEGKEIGRVGGYKQDVDALMERVDALVGRAQDPSANVCTDGKRKRKPDGKTSTPTGMTDDFEAACEQAKKEKKRILRFGLVRLLQAAGRRRPV